MTIDLIRRHFPECRGWKWPGEYLDHVYLDVDHMRAGHGWLIDEAKANRLLSRAARPVVKTHCRPGLVELGDAFAPFVQSLWSVGRAVYVYRDGRDVLCSAHMWMQERKPEARVSLSEFIRQPDEDTGLNRVRAWAEHVRTWRDQPGVLAVGYERLLDEPKRVIDEVAAHLGLTPRLREPLLPKRFRGPWHRRCERLVRFHPETTAVLGRYRGQKPLKWARAFKPEDRRYFHEHAGETLIDLGYVADDRWLATPPASPDPPAEAGFLPEQTVAVGV